MQSPDPWVAFTKAVGTGQEDVLRQAFEQLYVHALGELTRFAHWCVRQHNSDLVPGFVLDPEEVVEDAFSQLFLRCRGIRKDPKQWVLGFIRQKLRHDVARARREDKSKPDVRRQINGWQRKRKVRSSLSLEQQMLIREAVNSLPERMRAVIISMYYRAESVATTAARLGITENAVVQTRRRALKKLEGVIGRR